MDKELKEGMTLRFTEDINFMKDNTPIPEAEYKTGDTLYLIEPTGQDPHDYKDQALSDDVFWKVKSKHGVSVWTRIQRLYYQGILEIVD